MSAMPPVRATRSRRVFAGRSALSHATPEKGPSMRARRARAPSPVPAFRRCAAPARPEEQIVSAWSSEITGLVERQDGLVVTPKRKQTLTDSNCDSVRHYHDHSPYTWQQWPPLCGVIGGWRCVLHSVRGLLRHGRCNVPPVQLLDPCQILLACQRVPARSKPIAPLEPPAENRRCFRGTAHPTRWREDAANSAPRAGSIFALRPTAPPRAPAPRSKVTRDRTNSLRDTRVSAARPVLGSGGRRRRFRRQPHWPSLRVGR
jgi:hypothetical protein